MKLAKISIMLLVAITVVAGTALAAPVQIGEITSGIEMPQRVALDAQGSLYVTEPTQNRVKKYSSTGQFLSSFEVSYPLGIAVDANGKIYVGSDDPKHSRRNKENSVRIYDANRNFLGCLGGVCSGFGLPNDIAIDSSGTVYVVDSIDTVGTVEPSVVKVFGSNGVLNSAITGTGVSRLLRPMGVAINDAAGEIFITDSPVDSCQGNSINASRVSVFDKNGNLKRSFGKDGSDFSCNSSLNAIAIDSANTLYIADSKQSVVHTRSAADGTPVGGGGIYKTNSVNPVGVGIRNSLLYVAVQKTDTQNGRVDLYGLDGINMEVNPSALIFAAAQFSGNPPAQTVVIANTGTGTLTWSASADQAWITLGAQNPVGPSSSGGFDIGVDISALTAGAHTGKVTIASTGGQKAVVNVTLSVTAAPMLTISNQSLAFTLQAGSNTTSQPVTIGIDSGSSTWTAVSDAIWLTIAPAAGGAAPTVATVTAASAGLNAGTYTGHITVSAPGTVSDAKITVSLAVVTSGGVIRVTTNRPDASFTVSGPTTTTGSGMDWSAANMLAGTYRVTFKSVSGFKRPAPQTKTLAQGGVLTFSGEYRSWKDLAAKKNIVAAQTSLVGTGSQVKAFKGNGTATVFDHTVSASGASVAVGDIDGDSAAEVIAGSGDGSAMVRVYRADKTMLLEFGPVGATGNALRVAAADLNGDGRAEIIVENNGTVSVHAYNGAGGMISTGVTISTLYQSGAAIASADTEGDGLPEIITAPAAGQKSSGPVKIWKIDTMPAVGAWTAALQKEISAGGDNGATVAGGDINGDGNDEIIIASGGDRPMITIMGTDGFPVQFRTADKSGVNVAAADLDGDGNAEIVTAPLVGSEEKRSTIEQAAHNKLKRSRYGKVQDEQENSDHASETVRVYDAAGTLKYVITPFADGTGGINLAIGDLGF